MQIELYKEYIKVNILIIQQYTHIRYLCRHGKEIPLILFGAFVNIIYCENNGEDVTSGSLTIFRVQTINCENSSEDACEYDRL